MNRKLIRNLTPEAAWRWFVPAGVEEFVSDFIHDPKYDIDRTDYREMCRIYASELPFACNRPFLVEDLNYIADLLEKHIKSYIEKIGGEENLQLLTKEESDERYEVALEELISLLEQDKK